jgi:hypothetical protein
MALQLLDDTQNRWKLHRGVVDRKAVLGHLRTVLNSFASKGTYSKFYIGITGNVEERLQGHRTKRPDFKLMIPIYEEPANFLDDSFDRLERDAIQAFRGGIVHPETKKLLLACDNGPDGAAPKTTLYILVG